MMIRGFPPSNGLLRLSVPNTVTPRCISVAMAAVWETYVGGVSIFLTFKASELENKMPLAAAKIST